jgi:hypothetical protein
VFTPVAVVGVLAVCAGGEAKLGGFDISAGLARGRDGVVEVRSVSVALVLAAEVGQCPPLAADRHAYDRNRATARFNYGDRPRRYWNNVEKHSRASE